MVVNLCRDSGATNNLIKQSYSENQILDITGVINGPYRGLFRLGAIDENGELEVLAIKHYVNFIGSLSRASVDDINVRTITIADQPLFWFTPLAEKHDSFHWGKDAWILYTLLKNKAELFKTKTTILLPAAYNHIKPLLNEFFRITALDLPEFVYVGSIPPKITRLSNFIYALKSLIRSVILKWQLKLKKAKQLHSKQRNVFIFMATGPSDNNIETDGDLGAVFRLSSSLTESIGIPIFYTYKIHKYDWSNTDEIFLRAYPSYRQLWSLFLEQIKVYGRIISYDKKSCKVENVEIPFSLLLHEILIGWKYFSFLNFVWLSNYFKRLNNDVSVFYADEFYISGRIISAAARIANVNRINTYGVQHGLVLENHTVYRISNLELEDYIKKNDGMPKPDFFISWGTYFANLFLSYNSLPKDYVIPAGNLKYYQISQAGPRCNQNNKKIKILWCTTLLNFFKAEYAIIEAALKEMNNYELCFRLHPVNHIKREEIVDWVSPELQTKYSFSSEPNILDDIANHDVVITTVFSTAFFDALIMGKKTCRIFTGISKADFSNVKVNNLYDIKTTEDFRNMFTSSELMAEEGESISISDLCYLKDDLWKQILQHGKRVISKDLS